MTQYTDHQVLEAGSAEQLKQLVDAAIAQGKQPIGAPRIVHGEAFGARHYIQAVGTPAGDDPGPGPDPGGEGTLLLLREVTNTEVYEAYAFDRTTGVGASLGQYDFAAALEVPAIFPENAASVPGLLAMGTVSASGGNVAFFAPSSPFAKVAPGNIQTAAGGVAPIIAGNSDGLLFCLTLTAGDDTGAYTLSAIQVTAGVPAAVGTPLVSTFGHDTGFQTGPSDIGNKHYGQVIDGHFCVSIPNTSNGRGTGATLYAFSFNGTTFTLEDTLDLSNTNWNYRQIGPGFFVYAADLAAPNMKFIRYTAAGGFVDEFDYDIANVVTGTDVINWFIFDSITGRLYIGASDADYTAYRLAVYEPNFTTDTLELVANLTGIEETLMFPESAADDFLVMPNTDWADGFLVYKFTGTGLTMIGSAQEFGSPYEVELRYIQPQPA